MVLNAQERMGVMLSKGFGTNWFSAAAFRFHTAEDLRPPSISFVIRLQSSLSFFRVYMRKIDISMCTIRGFTDQKMCHQCSGPVFVNKTTADLLFEKIEDVISYYGIATIDCYARSNSPTCNTAVGESYQ
jgi:hypothetical protein